jgi:hypothetical protein
MCRSSLCQTKKALQQQRFFIVHVSNSVAQFTITTFVKLALVLPLFLLALLWALNTLQLLEQVPNLRRLFS